MPIRVLHIGLGPIGAAVVRQVATRPGFKAVGAIDIDPAKLGRDLGEVVGLERRLRVTVSDNLRAVVKATRPDVAVLCTSSSLKKVWPQIEAVLKLKLPIVSTTEELAYPWWNQKALSKKIDAAARKARVAVVGTGVNPGLHDGRAAHHADRRVPGRHRDHGQPHSGRAVAAPAVPAEDRVRPDHRRSSRRESMPAPCGMSGSPSRSR